MDGVKAAILARWTPRHSKAPITIMKILAYFALFLALIAVAVIAAGQLGFLGGRMPTNLGVQKGRLKPPSMTPNSVSSQAGLYPDHPQRDYARIEPLHFSGDPNIAMQKLADVLKSMDRIAVVRQEGDYLYAQATTPLLKFTDDMEFWLDRQAGVIELRSSSRLGRKDFGVNRQRIEAVRAQFQKN